MSIFRMRLPDVGEGVAEAELVQWFVSVGDEVTPESVLAEVLTDKATVEVSSPVAGVVTSLHGTPGDVLAVGSDLVEIETAAGEPSQPSPEEPAPVSAEPAPPPAPPQDADDAGERQPSTSGSTAGRPLAAPAVRERARSIGVDLADVTGSGPDGRVTHADLDRFLMATSGRRPAQRQALPVDDGGRAEPVRGVRRRIAERLAATWSEVPHITYVDAVDVSELERLRHELNRQRGDRGIRLTLLPFIAMATAAACAQQPRLNAHYDHATETLVTFDAVHLGVATQTEQGLLVPVVRHVESREVWDLATEIARVTTAARDGTASRDELRGSTITVTSLGAIGGLVTTPILNAPEVSIIGVNKIETRPVWQDGTFAPRQIMNLSSSFDHRIVDGWDAATFVQQLKTLLETPALLFVTDE
jgi:2-oxoisovalerate dehydrogenase E2 component (dihydrolipoyl transacylase)